MPLRFNTLKYPFTNCSLRKILTLLCLLNTLSFFGQSNIEDVKKEANKLFEDEEYTNAYKLYSQLVSNYPKDPVYNFRLGVCMIFAEPDKKKCLTYLQQADKNPEAPKETKFWLGKAYHINYQFNEAIKYYNDFKKVGPSSLQKKLQVDREIQACNNGKRLLSNLSDLVVTGKKTLNESDYYRAYDEITKTIGGKLLVKPDDPVFKTASDKKKKEKSVIYKAGNGDRIYFSSYGPNTDNGKDIYFTDRMPNGNFTPPVKVKNINTEYDEDYPFLHPNGKILYFSSKGHNSMGGYDIFKSTYNSESDSWSTPVNLEFPINSPDDDFLFVTDSLEKVASFSTGRQSLPGKIEVLRINTERKPIDVLALKGTVVKESADQSLKSKITVKFADNGEQVGVYQAQDNGDYLMDLPNGGKLVYSVETPGLETQSENVTIPLLAASKPLRQTISYENGKLKIINYFDENSSDESYLQYMKIIEKKATLDVNVGQNKLPELISMNEGNGGNDPQKSKGTGNTDSNTRPTVVEDTATKKSGTVAASTKTSTASGSLNNKQLADMAKQEAEESKKEAIQLKQDAADASELGNKITAEGESKIKQAEEAIKNAENISDEGEKKTALDNATALKNEGEAQKENGTKIIEYSKALENDGNNKAIITDLNNRYVNELENIISGKNKDPKATEKLDAIQKEITERSGRKNESDGFFNTIKNEADEKEKQVNKLEETNASDKAALQDIKNDISTKETELANTRKKKDKEPIQQQINELKTEQTTTEKKIETNEAEIKKAKEEFEVAKNRIDLANKVKNENIAAPINTTSIGQNTATSIASNTNAARENQGSSGNKISDQLVNKYAGKTTVLDDNSKASIEESNTQLKNFNKEIEQAIAKDKTDLTKAKTPQQKNELNSDIKKLEELKRQNQQELAVNNKKLEELAKNTAESNQKNNQGLNPITTNNKEEAIKQLNNLDTKISGNENSNFEYNGYQNPASQNLKIEADAKINEVALQQKKLKELIAGTSEQVKNAAPTGTTPPAVSASSLFKESEELGSKAFDLRAQANGKTGQEKDDLLAQAKETEDKGNQKHLEASDVLKNDNKITFDTNLENFEALKKEGKASEQDLNSAGNLMNEAATLWKQAAAMREEAASMQSIGAKLGGISNAEEKEAEALNKQKQAEFIMVKMNNKTVLKQPKTSENGGTPNAATSGTVDLTSQLQNVNNAINDLANAKLAAYQKLYEANKAELDALTVNIKNNQATIDKTPALKSEYISAGNKIARSETLKQNSDKGQDNNSKLADLIDATKAQTDALNQLAALDKKLNQLLASKGNAGTQTVAVSQATNNNQGSSNDGTVAATSQQTNNNQGSSNDGTVAATSQSTNNNQGSVNDGTVASVKQPTNDNQGSVPEKTIAAVTPTKTNSGLDPLASAKTVNVQELGSKDTTATEVYKYIQTNNFNLTNPGANQQKTNTLAELKKIEEEKKNLESGSNGGPGEPASQLKTKSDNLMVQAEELSVKSFDLKTAANSKTGPEKDAALAEAAKLEDESQNKKLEAVKINEQVNQAVYQNNNGVINEYIAKLKNDNPTLADQLSQKLSEVGTLKTQAEQLRSEANTLDNKNAKIGAMMNAEEKEAELLKKQTEVLDAMKGQYPDLVVKEPTVGGGNVPEDLKQKQAQLNEKQFNELTNLTNAYSLEYVTAVDKIPTNLSEEQKVMKQNADTLNAESKKLLIKASQTSDQKEKEKLLSMAVKAGNASVEQLYKVINPGGEIAKSKGPDLADNKGNVPDRNNNPDRNNGNPDRNNGNPDRNNRNPDRNNGNTNRNNGNPDRNTQPARNGGRATVSIPGFSVTARPAYNANRPIPIDAPVDTGLIFRVQIGAFRNRLPNNAFGGIDPVNGENTSTGWIRYTAGNFEKYENANAVKNDMRNLGYSDAFVVAYYKGRRITVREATDLLAARGRTIDNNAPATASITAKANIPKATNNLGNNPVLNAEPVRVTKELEQINGLLFTIQIGVYNRQVSQRQLLGLKPIYTEKTTSGLYRYTAGIYNNAEKLIADKNKVVGLGIRDAFVSAYLNGRRITFAEGKAKQQESTTQMEPENPIIFPAGGAVNNNVPANNNGGNNNVQPANNGGNNVQPFSNNIQNYPAATEENGIKTTQDGVCFKVQIGAYSRQVPNDVASKFLSIRNWPIENKQVSALYIYTVGNFTAARFAKGLLNEAKAAGITDAFITVYRDGVKLSGAESNQLINGQ